MIETRMLESMGFTRATNTTWYCDIKKTDYDTIYIDYDSELNTYTLVTALRGEGCTDVQMNIENTPQLIHTVDFLKRLFAEK